MDELERIGPRPVWLRELARRCQLNPGLVHYYLRKKLCDAVNVERRTMDGQRDLVFVSLRRAAAHAHS